MLSILLIDSGTFSLKFIFLRPLVGYWFSILYFIELMTFYKNHKINGQFQTEKLNVCKLIYECVVK